MNSAALAQVPVFPPVAAKLLSLPCDDKTGTADLIHLLRSDPALSAEIIRHANSPLYAFRSEVNALEQALTLLGVRRVRSLALTAITRTYVKGILMVEDLRAYWRYSVACGLVAEKLAGSQRVAEDTAYAAALLHDIGCLGLLVGFPVDYPRLLQAAAEKLATGLPFDLRQEERELFGMDRYEAGECLAAKWNLPEDLRAVVGRYDSGVAEEEPELIRIVLVAARIATSLGFAITPDPRWARYEQIRQVLAPEMAACVPCHGSDLQAHLEKRIALLDWDTCSFEQESAAQTLLNFTEPKDSADRRVTPTAHPWIWPLLAGAATLLAAALLYVQW
ncbi:MAG TPA: HDOD domain-containing protein [Bryobacteraceae bacterium]|nr:HDOD domain-containing protein [Bryobacteraceae bacterium]